MKLKTEIFLFGFISFSTILFCSPDLPESFGKTNFIIGADSSFVRKEKKDFYLQRALHVQHNDASIARGFFAPDDDVRDLLLNLIDAEQKSIYIAAFLLTDATVSRALLTAKNRGVDVQLVTDQFCCKSRHGRVGVLHDGGIDVLVYFGEQSGNNMSDIMHHKFIVFGKNLRGRAIVWTGSLNFTNSARLKNQENVILLDHENVVEQYAKHFEILKGRSVSYDKNMFRYKPLNEKKEKKKLAKNTKRMSKHPSVNNNRKRFRSA